VTRERGAMKYVDTNLSIRSSTILIGISWMLPLAFGYLAINKGFNPLFACLCSGLAGVLMGYFASRRAWNDYLKRMSRRAMIQYEIESSWQSNDDSQAISDSHRGVEPNIKIEGKTFERLQRSIAAFPACYPEYEKKQPKLDDDIRPWLKAAYGASDREAHVFGAIISEHFRF
jgi:hypothetical protein